MRKNQTFELVLTSIFVALIFLMGMVPQIGFITIVPGNPITILHIPVLIAAVLLSFKYFWIPGLAFGVVSLIQAAMNPVGLNIAFINPLVSILPRVLFVFAVFFLFRLFKILKNTKFGSFIIIALVAAITGVAIFEGTFVVFSNLSDNANYIIAGAIILVFVGLYVYLYLKHDFKSLVVPSIFIIGTLIHTFLVLASVALFSYDALFEVFQTDQVMDVIVFIVGFNGLTEAVIAALIGTPIYLALQRVPLVQQKLAKF
ncbi:ECF transporter S component [Acholeplasma laidlawii]|uniref:ECF transporter S component n=1 Tax=Acholeplasma laidlawii TaxID=2148 RepID=UPI000DA2AEF0|nr:ECF transporter S component [Acholeplasma laidlawii]SQH56997.1 Pantothenic acid ECF transporter S component PanT [Acholeplasma laidlawii]